MPTLTERQSDQRTLIREAVDVLREVDQGIIEMRAMNVPMPYGRPATICGWYDDYDKLASDALTLDSQGAPGIYVTLNPVNPDLLARVYNRFISRPAATTADRDIIKRVWLPIDVDPVRPSGISASEQEISRARQRTLDVADWLLKELGQAPDVRGFSGNGFHLLYRVDLPNNEQAKRMVKGTIDQIASNFSDNAVCIDRTVFNAARIWKLYGTTARKGDEVPEAGRIYRKARLIQGGNQP